MTIKGSVILFINDEDRDKLREAYKIIQDVFKHTSHEFREFPSIISALDSLETAINKNKQWSER